MTELESVGHGHRRESEVSSVGILLMHSVAGHLGAQGHTHQPGSIR